MATQMGSYDFKAAKAAHDEAAKKASDYITEITNDGIMVHAEGEGPEDTQTPTGWHISNVLEFIRQGVSRFWIGLKNQGDTTPTVRIGKDSGESRMELDYHSMQLIDKESNVYAYISDLRDSTGIATIVEEWDGEPLVMNTNMDISSIVSIVINGSDMDGQAIDPSYISFYERSISVNTEAYAPNYDETWDSIDSWTITYMSGSSMCKAYTLGTRASGSNIGAMSFAQGRDTISAGETSSAFGIGTKAYGRASFAEGYQTEAYNMAHAEGRETVAEYAGSHAEGYGTQAIGEKSHAQNYRTIAASKAQTAIGQYNVKDANDTYAVIIGNGTADNDRSNALTVDWEGTIESAGKIKADDSIGFCYSGGNRCTLNRSGDYLYVTASDANGNGVGAYRLNMATWGIVFRPWENGAWGSWETHIWNSAASRNANTILAAPNGSAGAATFRTLVPSDCSWLGDREVDDQSGNVSVANTTWVAIASVELAAGVWILNGNVSFASNATGRRYACIHSASPTTAAQRQCSANCNATNGAQTTINLAGSKTPTSKTTYTLYAYQTSGSTLNCTGYLAATRIK